MQKGQYFLKPTIFGRSLPKLIGFLRKHIQIYMRNFKTIGTASFELSRDKKLTTHDLTHTRARARAHTHITQSKIEKAERYVESLSEFDQFPK